MSQINPTTGLIETDPIKSAVDAAKRISVEPSRISQLQGEPTNVPSEHYDSSFWKTPTGVLPGFASAEDAAEQRALRQNALDKAVNGVAKFGHKILLYTSTALANVPYGLAQALNDGSLRSFMDNDLTRWAYEADNYLAEKMPHYYTNKERNSVLGGASNFLFDSVMGAMAFTTSAILTELLTAGLGKAAGMSNMIRRATGAYQTSKAASALPGQAMNVYRRMAAASTAYKAAKVADGALTFGRQLLTGAGFEATIEAQDFIRQAKEEFLIDYQNQNGRLPSVEEMEAFDKSLTGSADGVFLANMALVSMGNAFAFGRTFTFGRKSLKGLKFAEAEHILKKDKIYSNALNNLSKADKNWRRVGRLGERMLAEGILEEGGQGITKNTALSYLAASRSPEHNAQMHSFIDSLGHAMHEQFTTNEGWREMITGMLIGGLGAPGLSKTSKGKNKFWAGGVSEIWNQDARTAEEVDKRIKYLDNTLAAWESSVRDSVLAGEMAESLKNDDWFNYKNQEFLAFFNFVEGRLRAGHYNDIEFRVKEFINEMDAQTFATQFDYDSNMSDEKLEQRKREVVEKMLDRAEQVKTTIEDMSDISDDENVRRGVAVTLAASQNLDDRFGELKGSLEEYAENIDLGDLRRIYASNAAIGRRLDKEKEIISVINRILKKSTDGTKYEDASVSDILDDTTLAEANKDLTALRKELNFLIKREYDRRVEKRAGEEAPIYNETFEKFKKDMIRMLQVQERVNKRYFDSTEHAAKLREAQEALADIEKIEYRRLSLLRQYNRFLTKDGQTALSEILDELYEDMLDMTENAILTNARKKAVGESMMDPEATGRDMQTREYKNIGELEKYFNIEDNEETANKEDAQTELDKPSDIPYLSNLKDRIKTLWDSIPQLEDIQKLTLDKQKVELAGAVSIIRNLQSFLGKVKLEQAYKVLAEDVKAEVDAFLVKITEAADITLKKYEQVQKSVLEELGREEDEGEKVINEMFSVFDKLFRVVTKDEGNVADLVRNVAEEIGTNKQDIAEHIEQNLVIRVEPYLGEVGSFKKGAITLVRGFQKNGETVGAYVYYVNPNTGEETKLGGLFNPHSILFNNKAINIPNMAASSAYRNNLLRSLYKVSEEDDLNELSSQLMAFMAAFQEIETSDSSVFRMDELGLKLELGKLQAFKPVPIEAQKTLSELLLNDERYQARTKFQLGDKTYYVAYRSRQNSEKELEIAEMFVAEPLSLDETELVWKRAKEVLTGEEAMDLGKLEDSINVPSSGRMFHFLYTPKPGANPLSVALEEKTSKKTEVADVVMEEFGTAMIGMLKEMIESNLQNITGDTVKGGELFNMGSPRFFLNAIPVGVDGKRLNFVLTYSKFGYLQWKVIDKTSGKSYFSKLTVPIFYKDGKLLISSSTQMSRKEIPDGLTLEEHYEALAAVYDKIKNRANLRELTVKDFMLNTGAVMKTLTAPLFGKDSETTLQELTKKTGTEANYTITSVTQTVAIDRGDKASLDLNDLRVPVTEGRDMYLKPAMAFNLGAKDTAVSSALDVWVKAGRTFEAIPKDIKDKILSGELLEEGSDEMAMFQAHADRFIALFEQSSEEAEKVEDKKAKMKASFKAKMKGKAQDKKEAEEDTMPPLKLVQFPADHKINMERAVKELQRMFGPNVAIEDISDEMYAMALKGEVWGRFRKGIIGLNSALAGKGTEYHEAFHKVFRSFLSDPEIEAVLELARERYGKPTDLNTLRGIYPHLNEQELEDLWYEEQMADEFMGVGIKKAKESWLTRLFNRIKKWLNLTNYDEIDTLFNDIFSGKYRKAELKYNILSKQNIEVFSLYRPTSVDAKAFMSKLPAVQANKIYDTILANVLEERGTEVEAEAGLGDIIDLKIAEFRANLEDYLNSRAALLGNDVKQLQDLIYILSEEKNLRTIKNNVREKYLLIRDVSEDNLLEAEDDAETESEGRGNMNADRESFKKEITVGGYLKASQKLKAYLGLMLTPTNTLLSNRRLAEEYIAQENKLGLRTAADSKFLYNQLMKIGSNVPNKASLIGALKIISSDNMELKNFYQNWTQGIVKELNERFKGKRDELGLQDLEDLPLSDLENSSKFNMVSSEMFRSRINAFDMLIDNTGAARMLHANQRNLEKIITQGWEVNWNRKETTMPKAKAVFKDIVGTGSSLGLFGEVGVAYKKAKNKSAALTEKAVQLKEAFDTAYGMQLPLAYVKYSLVNYLANPKYKVNMQLADNSEEKVMYLLFKDANLATIDIDLLDSINTVKGSIYTEITEEGEVDKAMGISRIKDIAAASAIFDSTVIPTVYTSLEGKSIYDIIYNNFNVARTKEFQNTEAKELMKTVQGMSEKEFEDTMPLLIEKTYEAFPNKYVSDLAVESWLRTLRHNPLLEDIDTVFNNDFQLSFIGGIRETELEEVENEEEEGGPEEKTYVSKSTDKHSKKKGKSYTDADAKSKAVYILNAYIESTQGAIKEKNGKKFYFHKPHTPGDASTIPVLLMPKHGKNLKLIEKIIDSEVARIRHNNRLSRELYEGNVSLLPELLDGVHYKLDGDVFYSHYYDEATGKIVDYELDRNDITKIKISDKHVSLAGFAFFDLQRHKMSLEDIMEGNRPAVADVYEAEFADFVEVLKELNVVYLEDNVLKSGILGTDYLSTTDKNKVKMDMLESFFVSSWVNSFAYNTLMYGDPTRTSKSPVDFFKRIKRGMGAGTQYGSARTRILAIADVKENVESVDNSTVNRVDAQSWSHVLWNYTRIIKIAKGSDTGQARSIYSKLHRGQPLTEDDKQFLYDNKIEHQPNKTLGVSESEFFKTSIFTLLRSEVADLTGSQKAVDQHFSAIEDIIFINNDWASDPELLNEVTERYRKIYEEYEPIPGMELRFNMLKQMETGGFHITAAESALKGKASKVHVYDGNEFYFYKENKENKSFATELFDQDLADILVTDGFKEKTTDGTQKIQLIYSEQHDSTKEIEAVKVAVDGKQMAPSEVVSLYRNLLSKRVQLGWEQKTKEFKIIDANTGEVTQYYNYKLLMDQMAASLSETGADPHTLAFFELGEDGNPKYSLNHPTIAPKFQAMLLAFLAGNTLKHKVRGNKLTLASDWGMSFLRDANGDIIPQGKKDLIKANKNNPKSDLQFNRRREDGIYYTEIILSEHYLKQFGYTYQDFLNGAVPEELLYFHGVRIPTQDKPSMANYKVVDFVGAGHGNVAIVPKEITLLAGSDFDIDAIYTHIVDTFRAKGKNFKYGSYLQADTVEKAITYAQTEYSSANSKIYKKTVGKVVFPPGFEQQVKDNYKAYKEGRLIDIQPITREEANNMLLSASMALSVNDGNMKENLTPTDTATFEALEEQFLVEGKLKDKSNVNGVHSPTNNMRAEMGIENGETNIGIAALLNTILQLANFQGVRVIGGEVLKGRQFSIYNENTEDRINSFISELITVSTDDLKLQKSVKWNLNATSLGIVGNAAALGIPKEIALMMARNTLLHQSIIGSSALSTPVVSNRGGYKTPSFDTMLQQTIAEFANSYADLEILPDIFDINALDRIVDSLVALEAGEKLTQDQANLVFTMLKYSEELYTVSESLRAITRITQLIKGTKSNFEDMELIDNILEELGVDLVNGQIVKVNEKPNIIDVVSILNDPFIIKQIEVYKEIMKAASEEFVITQSPTFKEGYLKAMSLIREFDRQQIVTRNKVKNKLLGHLLVKALKNTSSLYSNFSLKDMLTDLTKERTNNLSPLQNDINTLRKDPNFRNNILLQKVLNFNNVVYNDHSKHGANSAYGYALNLIEGNTRNIKDQAYLDTLLQDFIDLLVTPSQVPNLAKKIAAGLVGYSMVKESFNFSQGSFIKQIHPEILSNVMNVMQSLELDMKTGNKAALAKLFGKSITEVYQDFIDTAMIQTDMAYSWKSVSPYGLSKLQKRLEAGKDADIDVAIDESDKEATRISDYVEIDGENLYSLNLFGIPKKAFQVATYFSNDLEFPAIYRKWKEKNTVLSIKFPRYMRQTLGENKISYKVLKYAKVMGILKGSEGKEYLTGFYIDANGTIVDIGLFMSKTARSYLGKNIREIYPEAVDINGIIATQAFYANADIINLNKVHLAAATEAELTLLKKKKGAVSPAKVFAPLGKEAVEQVAEASSVKEQFSEKLRFEEDQTSGYSSRTRKNASADATIAIAANFNSAGERLTKSSALKQGKKYIHVDVATNLSNIKLNAEQIVQQLNSITKAPNLFNTGISLNIAGNGIYTLRKTGYTQQQVDDFTYELIKAVVESPNLKYKIDSIRTGGQTGFDEAGAKAGIKLGIPTLILAPKNWEFRDATGTDIENEQKFKARFAETPQAVPEVEVKRPTKKSAVESTDLTGAPLGRMVRTEQMPNTAIVIVKDTTSFITFVHNGVRKVAKFDNSTGKIVPYEGAERNVFNTPFSQHKFMQNAIQVKAIHDLNMDSKDLMAEIFKKHCK